MTVADFTKVFSNDTTFKLYEITFNGCKKTYGVKCKFSDIPISVMDSIVIQARNYFDIVEVYFI